MSVSSWPNSIAQFSPVQDYTGPNSVVLAATMNAIFAEIVSLEKGLGLSPLAGLPYLNLAAALNDLYNNKAPTSHGHSHVSMVGDASGDDHPQYMLVDGSRAFTGAVTAPPAVSDNQLATLGQVSGAGFLTSSAVEWVVISATAQVVHGAPSGGRILAGSVPGSGPMQDWRFYGGKITAITDGGGSITVTWPAFSSGLVGFTASCMMGGEVSLTLTNTTLYSARVELVDANGNLMVGVSGTFSWTALGC